MNTKLTPSELLVQEAFIRILAEKYTNSNGINWYAVCKNEKLSDSFIRKLQGHLDWEAVAEFQVLSEDIIKEFAYRMNWTTVIACQNVSVELKRYYEINILNDTNTKTYYED
jgi:hypothetical protein